MEGKIIMEQNNFNYQDSYSNMDYSTQQPYTQTTESRPQVIPELEECVNAAFVKALVAAILGFGVGLPILPIIFGNNALNKVKEANELAAYYGVSAGGKAVAAKILGLVGKINGIIATVVWAVYIAIFSVYLFVYVILIGAMM